MTSKHFFRSLCLMSILALACVSCEKDDYTPYRGGGSGTGGGGGDDGSSIPADIQLADKFALEYLDTYYLWNREIDYDLDLLSHKTCKDPIATVEKIRYKEDKWTALYDDISRLTNNLTGVQTTFGYYIQYGNFTNSNTMFGLVAYVYDGSPAQKAGLKRGDFIMTINGEDITRDNLDLLFDASSLTIGLGKLINGVVEMTGEEITLAAVKMYEDPVIAQKILDVNGKKVGYLAYTTFDLNSISRLISIFQDFKSQGVKTLVLDLRYNGGGYVVTEEAVASMLAPQTNVQKGDVYQKNVYNPVLTDFYKENGTPLSATFKTEFSYKDDDNNDHVLSTKNANMDLQKIYVLVTHNTASASEGLIVGLKPYVDITVIGEQTHGKFCTGVIFKAEDTRSYKSLTKWGLYCMIGTFSDCNGNNPCRPDGIVPNLAAEDNPAEGFELGNVNESMLKAAIGLIGGGRSQMSFMTKSMSHETGSQLGELKTLLPKNHFEGRVLLPSDLK